MILRLKTRKDKCLDKKSCLCGAFMHRRQHQRIQHHDAWAGKDQNFTDAGRWRNVAWLISHVHEVCLMDDDWNYVHKGWLMDADNERPQYSIYNGWQRAKWSHNPLSWPAGWAGSEGFVSRGVCHAGSRLSNETGMTGSENSAGGLGVGEVTWGTGIRLDGRQEANVGEWGTTADRRLRGGGGNIWKVRQGVSDIKIILMTMSSSDKADDAGCGMIGNVRYTHAWSHDRRGTRNARWSLIHACTLMSDIDKGAGDGGDGPRTRSRHHCCQDKVFGWSNGNAGDKMLTGCKHCRRRDKVFGWTDGDTGGSRVLTCRVHRHLGDEGLGQTDGAAGGQVQTGSMPGCCRSEACGCFNLQPQALRPSRRASTCTSIHQLIQAGGGLTCTSCRLMGTCRGWCRAVNRLRGRARADGWRLSGVQRHLGNAGHGLLWQRLRMCQNVSLPGDLPHLFQYFCGWEIRHLLSFKYGWRKKKYLKLPPAWLLLFTALIRFNFQQIYQEQIFIPLESALLETMLRYHKYFTLANKVPLSAHKHFFPPAFTLFTQIPDWSSLFWVSMSQCALINDSLQYTHDAAG